MPAAFRWIARLILLLLLLGSLTLTGINAWFLYRSPLGTILVERSEDKISARIERLLAHEVISTRSASRPDAWLPLEVVAEMDRHPLPLSSIPLYRQALGRGA